jgi:methylmalonyl-CoA mutase
MPNDNENSSEIKLDESFSLQSDFNIPNYEDWKAQVEKDLKGASFEKLLLTKTYEGINLEPIYTSSHPEKSNSTNTLPGSDNLRRGLNASGYLANSWHICQELPTGDAEKFNSALKTALKGGQNSINILLDLPTKLGIDSDYGKIGEVGKDGLAISALLSISRALDGIDLPNYPIHIDAGFSALPIFMIFNAYLNKTGRKIQDISGSIVADPIGFYADKEELPVTLGHAFEEMSALTRWTNLNAPKIKTIGVSGLPYHDAGANSVQELSYMLATVVTYINVLLEKGINLNEIVNSIRVKFGIGPQYFTEVAKLRAWKILWNNLVNAYRLKEGDAKISVHARTSSFHQSKFDPYVNMLRTTTEAFSAIVGGVDCLHTNTFDEAIGESSEFSRRIARNTQIILKEESHLDQLIDPAGGSYYIEFLTDSIAKNAWLHFQEIEKMGGMIKALESGFIQSSVESVNEKRKADVRKRKAVIVGTNMFANVNEVLLDSKEQDLESFHKLRSEYLQKYRVSGDSSKHLSILDKLNKLMDVSSDSVISIGIEAVLEGATIGEISNSLRAKTNKSEKIKGLSKSRLPEIFEQLRMASLKFAKENGEPPKVFLANMGSLKEYKARADFSEGFFNSGGFKVISPKGFDSVNEAVKSISDSKAEIIVICSTDDLYPELVPKLASAIKEKNSNITLILAGYPKDQIEEHKNSGIDDFIYLGCDVYEVLIKLLKKVGAVK